MYRESYTNIHLIIICNVIDYDCLLFFPYVGYLICQLHIMSSCTIIIATKVGCAIFFGKFLHFRKKFILFSPLDDNLYQTNVSKKKTRVDEMGSRRNGRRRDREKTKSKGHYPCSVYELTT